MLRRWFFLPLPSLLGVLLLLLLSSAPQALEEDVLFVPAAVSLADRFSHAGESQNVVVNFQALRQGQAPSLELPLMGRRVTAVRQELQRPAPDRYVWVGHVPTVAHSRVILSVSNASLAGEILLSPAERYNVLPLSGDRHRLQRLTPARQPLATGDDVLYPPSPAAPGDDLQAAACEEDGSRVDVLIAYTAAARQASGGPDGMAALINKRMALSNVVNSDSDVATQLRLVHAAEVAYVESGDLSVDLQRLQTPGDGYLDEVRQWRDTYKADLVALLIDEGNDGFCGYAYVMTSPATWFADYAYSVTALDHAGGYTCPALVLTHELGHNFGNQHDRANTSGTGVAPYAYGYQSPSLTFRTVMAYNCDGGCPYVANWSNPHRSYQGEPLGIDYDLDPARAADNARSMNEVAPVVANFRANCDAPSATATATPGAANPTATSTATATLSPTPGASPSATPSPTLTIIPTATPTLTSSPTTTPLPSPSATQTAASTPTATPLPRAQWRLYLAPVMGE